MDKELFALFDDLALAQRRRTTYHAKLGDGNQGLRVTGPNDVVLPGYVWALVQMGDGAAVSLRACRNHAVSEQYGLPVLVSFGIDGILDVIGEDRTISEQFSAAYGTAGVPEHGWTHSLMGADPVWVNGFQILPGLVHPTDQQPDLFVTVEPFFYEWEGVQSYYPGESLDLTTYVPASEGYQCLVVICHDPNTNACSVVDATPVLPVVSGDGNIPFSDDDVNAIDCGGLARLAAIRLYYGQTEIGWYDCVANTRSFVYGAGATPSYPARSHWFHDTSFVVTGNAIAITVNTSQPYGFYANQNTGALNDVFMGSAVLMAGSYTIKILGLADPGSAKVDIDFKRSDAGSYTNIVTGQDWYAAAPTFNTAKTETFTVPTNGRYLFRFTAASKNALSSGYTLAFTAIDIFLTAGDS